MIFSYRAVSFNFFMAKVQTAANYGSCYCEICLRLAVVKVNPSVIRMLTSIYIYTAFITFGLWSKKQQRSEGLGEPLPGLDLPIIPPLLKLGGRKEKLYVDQKCCQGWQAAYF